MRFSGCLKRRNLCCATLTAVCGVRVQLRAETVSDRSKWIAALQMCKEQLGGSLTPTIRSSLSSFRRTSLSQGRVAGEVMQCVDKVSDVLADLGLSAEDSRRVSQTMVECVSQLHSRSRREVDLVSSCFPRRENCDTMMRSSLVFLLLVHLLFRAFQVGTNFMMIYETFDVESVGEWGPCS
jgi:hypothetical protein